MDSRFVRQPVVTSSQEVFAYELLCGGTPAYAIELGLLLGESTETENLQASSALSNLSDGMTSFVRFDRRQLESHQYKALPAEQFVIEIPETELPDRALTSVCREARRAGYRIALNDFVVEPRLQPMLDCIDLLKVDFPALTNDQHRQILKAAADYHFDTIADRTLTPADFDRARKLGYQFFQGNFYCQPDLRNLHRLATGQMQLLRVLQTVNHSEFQVEVIDQLIRQDVTLSVKLLRYLNSSAFGLRSKVSSIRQAVALLGHRPLQRWVTLLSVSELCQQKPMVLMNTSLIRAKLCEAIGERILNATDASECFLMGLLSLLDAVLDQPMADILSQLSLSQTIVGTLLGQSSTMSPVLELVQCMEDGDFRRIAALVYELQCEEAFVFEEYRKACSWAADVFSGM
jgi:c-di-GMP-related signal transduction protein